MNHPKYSASLSRTQGRSGYSVIFRHPARRDTNGKFGVRVRRGLGTRDETEAKQLQGELNLLLADSRYHDPAARPEAERRFNSRVVGIFFDKLAPEQTDFMAIREGVIELPESNAEGYRRVLLLGTTGAGKTTLVRQLIGTDPATERFPSTSTAKTTIHDTEIVLADGDWRGVVTFAPSDEVREYLNECMSAAVLAAAHDASDAEVLRHLLNHVNQRYRFSYVLGNGPTVESIGSDFDDEEMELEDDGSDLLADEECDAVDMAVTQEVLAQAVKELRELAARLGQGLRTDLEVHGDEDERVAEEIFEEELDNLLRDDDSFHRLADALMDEIEKRFNLLPPGEVQRTRQGWPLMWRGEWRNDERSEFLQAVSRFSSNYAPLYGRLLTPLVNGVRVAGPFAPTWNGGEVPKLALFDGEGLGHTPKSSSAISTTVSRRIETTDAVLLVDNATQPMLAAPLAAMREIVATGNARKLILAFSHFDEVKGDNLPSASAKAAHVLASAENVLAAFGEELGSFAERALRQRLERARFFLADIHEPLDGNTPSGRRTITQFRKLLDAIDAAVERPELADARPIYDRMNLVLAIRAAAEAFHGAWRPRLGLDSKPGFTKEHWTRVKALSRRLAEGWADEYDTLRPIADARHELVERIYVFVQNPVRWEGAEPADDQKQACFDALSENLSGRLLAVCARRAWHERSPQWQDAYNKRGTGSTFVRAEIIGDDIYERAIPVPDVMPSPDRNHFLREIITEVDAAASETGAKLE